MLEESWEDGKAGDNDADGELRETCESDANDVEADICVLRELETVNGAQYRGHASPEERRQQPQEVITRRYFWHNSLYEWTSMWKTESDNFSVCANARLQHCI